MDTTFKVDQTYSFNLNLYHWPLGSKCILKFGHSSQVESTRLSPGDFLEVSKKSKQINNSVWKLFKLSFIFHCHHEVFIKMFHV